MRIYYCKSNETPDIDRISSIMPADRIEKSLRLPKEKQPASFAAGLLLSYAILSVGEIDSKLFTLPNGKPVLLNSPYHISLSHSKNHAIAAIHTKNIGVDIQVISLPRSKLIQRVCSTQEAAYIAASPCPATAFTSLWVLKESYVKLTGCGITENISAINFVINKDNIAGPSGCSFTLCYEVEGAVIGTCLED